MSDIKRVWANPESLWSEGRVKFVEGVELIYASDYDAAQIELAALREELAKRDALLDALNCSGVMQLVRHDLAESVNAIVKETQSIALLAALNHAKSGENHDPS